MKPYFIMTVDVDPPFSSKQNYVIEKGVTLLLDLFNEHKIKATFFVPAVVAEKFPATVKRIVECRHEVACHGLKHEPSETSLCVNRQIEIIKKATKIIEDTIGIKPIGFRAPLFKVNRSCWIALYKNGYLYDSSIVPSPLYWNYEVFLFSEPFFLEISEKNENPTLLEIPVSVNPLLLLPLGGAWLRIFGLKWAKIGIKINFTFPAPTIFYIHPKDVIYDNTRGLKWYFYKNTGSCLKILNKIIKYVKQNKARFITARDLAKLYKAYSTKSGI